MKQQKILFVYSHWQSFVRDDFHFLSDVFEVKRLQFRLEKNFSGFIVHQIKGIFNLIFSIPKNDVVFIWFCDYHTFWSVLLARLFRKKSVIVSGGFDAVKIPSINYGLFMQNGLRSRMAKLAYTWCDRIIAVDESLIEGKNSYAGAGAVTGIAHFVPNIQQKSVVIPTGYSSEKWIEKPKKQQVTTAALIKDKKVFARKGIRLFLECAKNLPDISFYLIGLQEKDLIPEHLRDLKNVIIYPVLPQEELIDLYAESKVYCQFSLSEGLPNVLCEAMMSGCVPVGSSANGIPKAIGDCGFILEEQNTEKATELIKLALTASEEQQKCARERIQRLFPDEQRVSSLKKIIEEL